MQTVFAVRNQFSRPMPGVPINEFFGPFTSDYTNEDWPAPTPFAYVTESEEDRIGEFADKVFAKFDSPFIPQTEPPFKPYSNIKVQHGSQKIYAGSTTFGRGILMKF